MLSDNDLIKYLEFILITEMIFQLFKYQIKFGFFFGFFGLKFQSLIRNESLIIGINDLNRIFKARIGCGLCQMNE